MTLGGELWGLLNKQLQKATQLHYNQEHELSESTKTQRGYKNYLFIQHTGVGSEFTGRVTINAIFLVAPKKVFFTVIGIISIGFLACRCAIYQNSRKTGIIITVHSFIFY